MTKLFSPRTWLSFWIRDQINAHVYYRLANFSEFCRSKTFFYFNQISWKCLMNSMVNILIEIFWLRRHLKFARVNSKEWIHEQNFNFWNLLWDGILMNLCQIYLMLKTFLIICIYVASCKSIFSNLKLRKHIFQSTTYEKRKISLCLLNTNIQKDQF